MRRKLAFNLTVLALFFIALIISQKTGLDWLKFLPGVLLLYYLPGNNLNDLLFRKIANHLSWYTKLALDVTNSIAIVYLAYSLLRHQLIFIETNSYVFIILLNLILLATTIGYFLLNKKDWPKFPKFTLNRDNKRVLFLITIPVVLFLIRLGLNPYIHEIDSHWYFDAYNSILQTSYDASWLSGQRNAFALFMIYSHYLAGLSFIGLFKFFVPLLFFFTSLVLLEFTERIKNKRLASLAYLLILGSPMLTIMNEWVRPETFVLALTLPMFYLIFLAIERKLAGFLIIALLYAYISYRFHEFGIFAIFITLFAFVVAAIKYRSELISFVKSKPALAVLLLLPWLMIIKQNSALLAAVSVNSISAQAIPLLLEFIKAPQINWWFLDRFQNVDGGVIEWPGLNAALYYLYNGLGVIGLVMILGLILWFAKTKHTKHPRGVPQAQHHLGGGIWGGIWPMLPIYAFLAAYLTIAEVLPRMGVFIFPNRTWPHIMLAMVFTIAAQLVLAEVKKISINDKILSLLVLLVVVSGIVGSTFVSVFIGGQVLPSEKNLIKAIKALPPETVVLSTQSNSNLVKIYGNKSSITIEQVKFGDGNDFRATVNRLIENYHDNFRKNLLAFYLINEKKYLIINKRFKQDSLSILDLPIKDENEKLALIEKYDPNEYAHIQNQLKDIENINEKPIHFLYSFAKFEGLQATRKPFLESADPQNLKFFKNYSGGDVGYKDSAGILIKMR